MDRREFLVAGVGGVVAVSLSGCTSLSRAAIKKEEKVKKLDGLHWEGSLITELACVKGCLNYLGKDVSMAWVFGATGYAFVLNMHESVSPGCPNGWKKDQLPLLGRNVGYTLQGVTFGGHRPATHASFDEGLARAQDFIREAIASGTPCFAWQGDQKEYCVVNGFDDSGFYISGPGAPESAVPWSKLADAEFGWVEVFSVVPRQPASDTDTVKAALEFAIGISGNPNPWVLPDCKTGLEAYDLWTASLESKKAFWFGNSFNAAAWAECRRHAVDFLSEAKSRLVDLQLEVFDEAIGHYTTVRENMTEVAEAFPFGCANPDPTHMEDETRVAAVIAALKAAQDAERAGLGSLNRIVGLLRDSPTTACA